MRFSYDDRIQMARECFDINEFVNGTLSGGIETPKRIIYIDAKNSPEKSSISISYTYDDNLYYTDLRAGKTFTTIYSIGSNGHITRDGSDKLFSIDESDPFYDLCEREIAAFFEKWAAA